ncbi:chemotaxis protein CheW [Pseudoduganella umbonata]|uniref:Chemotaxis protein CheW n=1 Tax=Pseudoduganella umbonata TaxID=864828 RepID=A0A4P8HV90_9BURK|nr:chemotaxis protein CheW [Pseudoduganella umbonata]MBB3224192.1 chemotaxis-related protein WspD [Pseudoduganella umbonata]QCP13949.1 chemotaxis protein CheW [Pseudoduganella umbonata]
MNTVAPQEQRRRSTDGAIDDAYLHAWAEHFRAPLAGSEIADASAVAFRIGAEWLALPTSMLLRVAPHVLPHRVPHRGARGLRGIVNVGGQLYPCIALADLLGIDAEGGSARTGRHTFARLLLVQWETRAFALPVADLHGIVRYAESRVQPPAATINKGVQRYLSGVVAEGDMRVGLLDAALLGPQLARALR